MQQSCMLKDFKDAGNAGKRSKDSRLASANST